MKILLDTSAYVGFKRNTAEVVRIITLSESVLISPVVLGELQFGFRGGSRFQENMDDLYTFLEHDAVEILSIGTVTADRYSRIAAELKRRGTPIPSNDIWVAAQTFEHGAELVTADRHFEKIGGLFCTFFQLP